MSSFHFEAWANHELCGAAWFIYVLFELTIIFAIECWMLRFIKKETTKNLVLLIISLIALMVGYKLYLAGIFYNDFLSVTISSLSLYTIGYLLKNCSEKFLNVLKRFKWIIFFIGIVFWYNMADYGSVALNVNYYVNPLYLLACSLMGWFWLRAIADIMESWPVIFNAITYIGQKILFILFLHFLGFKIVNLIQVLYYGEPAYLIASFSVYKGDGLWWVLHVVVGIGFSLIVEYIWQRFKCWILKLDKELENDTICIE